MIVGRAAWEVHRLTLLNYLTLFSRISSRQKETHAYNDGTAGADASMDVSKLHNIKLLAIASRLSIGGIKLFSIMNLNLKVNNLSIYRGMSARGHKINGY